LHERLIYAKQIKSYPRLRLRIKKRLATISSLRKGSLQQNLFKKSLGIHSYLKRTIQHARRKFNKPVLKFKRLKTYRTRGLPHSRAHLYSNQLFKIYYSHLKKKHLLSVFKKSKLIKGKLGRCQHFTNLRKIRKLSSSDILDRNKVFEYSSPTVNSSKTLYNKYSKANLLFLKKKYISKQKNESARNFITCLEERLDNTLLRSIHFKTTYNTHFEGLIPNQTNFKLFEREKRLTKKKKPSLPNKSNKSYRLKTIKQNRK